MSKDKAKIGIPICDRKLVLDLSKISIHKFYYYQILSSNWSKNNAQCTYMDQLYGPVPLIKTDDFLKILQLMLKKDTANQIMMKEEQKDHYLQRKK